MDKERRRKALEIIKKLSGAKKSEALKEIIAEETPKVENASAADKIDEEAKMKKKLARMRAGYGPEYDVEKELKKPKMNNGGIAASQFGAASAMGASDDALYDFLDPRRKDREKQEKFIEDNKEKVKKGEKRKKELKAERDTKDKFWKAKRDDLKERSDERNKKK